MTATAERQAADVEASEGFDPLVDLYGMWTVDLAEKYLPIPGVPRAKYECWDGRLFMAPYEGVQNSYGEMELGAILRQGAREAGLYVCGPVNLVLGEVGRWIQPDVTIIDAPLKGTWVAAESCVLTVEFVSPASKRRDRIDKPIACAAVGIPWFMTVELNVEQDHVIVDLSRLDNGRYVRVAKAFSGQEFVMTEPFKASFDPAQLLMR